MFYIDLISAFSFVNDIFSEFWGGLLSVIDNIGLEFGSGTSLLQGRDLNIYLFSETGWFSGGLNLYDLILYGLVITSWVFLFIFIFKFIKLPFKLIRGL